MIKFVMMLLLMVAGTSSMAGECTNGKCTLRSRTVNVTREIVAVPVTVTRRTVQTTLNVGSRAVNRCRSVVR
jgi:hypothetical protein